MSNGRELLRFASGDEDGRPMPSDMEPLIASIDQSYAIGVALALEAHDIRYLRQDRAGPLARETVVYVRPHDLERAKKVIAEVERTPPSLLTGSSSSTYKK